jgi:hypothetical protein
MIGGREKDVLDAVGIRVDIAGRSIGPTSQQALTRFATWRSKQALARSSRACGARRTDSYRHRATELEDTPAAAFHRFRGGNVTSSHSGSMSERSDGAFLEADRCSEAVIARLDSRIFVAGLKVACSVGADRSSEGAIATFAGAATCSVHADAAFVGGPPPFGVTAGRSKSTAGWQGG